MHMCDIAKGNHSLSDIKPNCVITQILRGIVEGLVTLRTLIAPSDTYAHAFRRVKKV